LQPEVGRWLSDIGGTVAGRSTLATVGLNVSILVQHSNINFSLCFV